MIPLGVPARGRVVVSEAVDETHLRTTRENRFHIDDRHTGDVSRPDNVERANRVRHLRAEVRLRRGNHDILSPFVTPATFVEQFEGLADSRGVAEKDLQLTAALGPFGGLDLTEQGFRITMLLNTHRTQNSLTPGVPVYDLTSSGADRPTPD